MWVVSEVHRLAIVSSLLPAYAYMCVHRRMFVAGQLGMQCPDSSRHVLLSHLSRLYWFALFYTLGAIVSIPSKSPEHLFLGTVPCDVFQSSTYIHTLKHVSTLIPN